MIFIIVDITIRTIITIIHPLVIFYIAMKNHHAAYGKTRCFNCAIFNSYVKLAEGSMIVKSTKEYKR